MKTSKRSKLAIFTRLKGTVSKVNTGPLTLGELEKAIGPGLSLPMLSYSQIVAGIELVKLERSKHEKGSYQYVKWSARELILNSYKLEIQMQLLSLHKAIHATI